MALKKGVDVKPAKGKLGILLPGMGAVATTFIAKCHSLGLRVDFWVIDDRDEAERLLALGADGIMTNDPATLRPVVHPS